MKVKMKLKEKQANDYSERHKRNWEHFSISNSAYLNGYMQALENIKYNGILVIDNGEEEVEVEFKNGNHQIGSKSTDKDEIE